MPCLCYNFVLSSDAEVLFMKGGGPEGQKEGRLAALVALRSGIVPVAERRGRFMLPAPDTTRVRPPVVTLVQSTPSDREEKVVKPPRPQRIFTGSYKGPTEPKYHNRDVSDVEGLFRELGTTFDNVIVNKMKAAEKEGRTSITVVDVGSGDGGLLRGFLENPSTGVLSRIFLQNHPDFRIKMVGLTDTPKGQTDLHSKEKPLGVSSTELDTKELVVNGQIEAKNYYYTLSRTQTLDTFLNAQGITTIDAAIACESMRYMGSTIFGETVKTVVNRLTSSGEFIASGAIGGHPGFAGLSEKLNIQHIPNTGPSKKQMLDTYTSAIHTRALRLANEPGDFEAEKEAFEEAANMYVGLQILTPEDIELERIAIDIDEKTQGLSEREKLHVLANRTLSIGLGRLFERKNNELIARKVQILDDLEGVTVQRFHLRSDVKRGFRITKKSEAELVA